MDLKMRSEQKPRWAAECACRNEAVSKAMRHRHDAGRAVLPGPAHNKVVPADVRERWDAENGAIRPLARPVANRCYPREVAQSKSTMALVNWQLTSGCGGQRAEKKEKDGREKGWY